MKKQKQRIFAIKSFLKLSKKLSQKRGKKKRIKEISLYINSPFIQFFIFHFGEEPFLNIVKNKNKNKKTIYKI